MRLLTLSLSERRALAKHIHDTKDVKVFKRTQAFLWLYEGMSVQEISQRFGLSRQTIYDWVSAYQNRRNMSFRSRLQDRPKTGRPPKKSTIILREPPLRKG
jgi:transposase